MSYFNHNLDFFLKVLCDEVVGIPQRLRLRLREPSIEEARYLLFVAIMQNLCRQIIV